MKRNKGFTLIELIIVMVIIGILATIGAGNFRTTRDKARDARRKSDLETISKSLEAYFNDHREYPRAESNRIVCQTNEEGVDVPCPWGAAFVDDEGTIYNAELPQDPAGRDYVYAPAVDGLSFALYARLDNPNDPSIAGEYAFNCGTVSCNYVITSTNITNPAPTPEP